MLTRRQNNSFRSFGETQMKYFILCPYCNKIYIVDGENQVSFTCPNCGASNKYEDVVHAEDDEEKIRQAAKELVRQQEELRGKEEAFLYLQKRQNENRPPLIFPTVMMTLLTAILTLAKAMPTPLRMMITLTKTITPTAEIIPLKFFLYFLSS